MKDLLVLYEDNHVIAVYKPAGMPVQEDESKDPTLLDQVKWFLKNKYQKPGAVFLGLVHRLDRPVSGVMLFGKTSKGASRLSEQIRAHTLTKEYHALVSGVPHMSSGTLINYLRRDASARKTVVVQEGDTDAEYAELAYTVEEEGDGVTLVRIQLKTGRHHQIRAQFAHIGHPLVGDVKYGARLPWHEGRGIALVATRVVFRKAVGEEMVEVQLPKEFWPHI
jgi:23S rRNA pseudouridine1911/1915/1917 synthase